MPIGLLTTAQVQMQSSFGTALTTSMRGFPFITESIEHKIEMLQEKQMYGRLGDSPRYNGKRSSEGKFNFTPRPSPLNFALWMMCGQDTVAFATSLATHKFRPLNTTEWDAGASALQPVSILFNRQVGSSMLYSDLVANELDFTLNEGELMSADLSFVGGNYADNANVAPVYQPNDPPWQWNQVSYSYGGVALVGVRKFTLKHTNNVAALWTQTVNSGNPTRVVRNAPVDVGGTLTVMFQSNSLMADFLAASERQLKATFTNGSFQFNIDVPNFRVTKWPVMAGGPGPIEAQMEWVAEFEQVNSNYQVEYTLTNTLAVFP